MPSPIQSESPPSIILPNFTLNQKEINLRNVEFITPWQGWNNSACGGHPTTTKKKLTAFSPICENQTSKTRYMYSTVVQQSKQHMLSSGVEHGAPKRQPMFTIIERQIKSFEVIKF